MSYSELANSSHLRKLKTNNMKEALKFIEELIADSKAKRDELNVNIGFAKKLHFNDEVSALQTKRNYVNRETDMLNAIKNLIPEKP